MNKNIIIGILIVISIVSIVFGFYQKSKVNKLSDLTIKNTELSNELLNAYKKLQETETKLKNDSLKIMQMQWEAMHNIELLHFKQAQIAEVEKRKAEMKVKK